MQLPGSRHLFLKNPSFASGSQKIGDFLGVAMSSQQHETLFASLKRAEYRQENLL